MITIWHKTTDFQDRLFYKSGLIPIAILDSDSLRESAHINPKQLGSDVPNLHLITTPNRNTSVGDILYETDGLNGKCWQITVL